jgi:hypothetical protein
VQIKDLDVARRALSLGGAPTAGRATPIEQGDVLLAARGERNIVTRPDEGLLGAYPTLDIYLLRPDSTRLDPDYLTAFLEGDGGKLLRAAKAGSSLPRLPIDAVADLELPLPSIDRQRAIGRVAANVAERLALLSKLCAAERQLGEMQLAQAFQAIH